MNERNFQVEKRNLEDEEKNKSLLIKTEIDGML